MENLKKYVGNTYLKNMKKYAKSKGNIQALVLGEIPNSLPILQAMDLNRVKRGASHHLAYSTSYLEKFLVFPLYRPWDMENFLANFEMCTDF